MMRLCKLPDNEIAATSTKGLVHIYNYKNASYIRTLNTGYGSGWGIDVIYLGQNKIATSHDDGLRIWNYQTKECLHKLIGEKGSNNHKPNRCKAIVTIGNNKIACSRDGFMEIWNFETGKRLQKIDDHRQVLSYTLHA
jgi:COMPASS component SWD3